MLKSLRTKMLLATLLLAPVLAGAQGLVEQALDVRLQPSQQLLEARATITLDESAEEWPAGYRLAPQAQIEAVAADDRPVPFRFAAGMLQIEVPAETTTLAIAYRARFDDPLPQDTVGIEDPSFGVTATISADGAFLSAAAAWHPQPIEADSRFRVAVTGPPGWSGVTDGRLVASETTDAGTTNRWQTRRPRSALTLAAGPYQVARDDLGDIQLLVFTGTENASLAAGYLESSREYLQLYQQLFGPYPFSKFAVVENFLPTGYGLPGWTLLGSSVIRLPFIRTTSLPHEIAHTWWGNGVEVDYATGNWCEGLATYVADYYLKELDEPAAALEYRRKILRDYAALIDAGDDLPLTDFRHRTTRRNQAVGYGKTAMVFHMLRRQIGDAVFWSGLREVARDGLGKRYAWSDLERHFEAVSGRELTTFFAQWTERTGAPSFSLDRVSVNPVGGGWQVSGTVAQQAPYYELTVPLRLESASEHYEQTIELTGAQGRFTFTVPDRPLRLAVDPESDLFRTLFPEEIPATVNDLRASRSRLVVVAAGAEALAEPARDLLRGLQWQDVPVVSERDYLAAHPADFDLLVIGWPESPDLQPALPENIRIGNGRTLVDGQAYGDEQDVLFMVLPGRETEQVAGYFLPGSPAAAQDTARRIPHYGRYSYLAFQDGRNQIKATWAADRSPLQMDFDSE